MQKYKMTFVEYCESISEQPLSEWQKTYLNEAYEISKKLKTPFIFPPRRGNGKSMTELITMILLSEYEKYIGLIR